MMIMMMTMKTRSDLYAEDSSLQCRREWELCWSEHVACYTRIGETCMMMVMKGMVVLAYQREKKRVLMSLLLLVVEEGDCSRRNGSHNIVSHANGRDTIVFR